MFAEANLAHHYNGAFQLPLSQDRFAQKVIDRQLRHNFEEATNQWVSCNIENVSGTV